jgi:hypothetical protein
MLGIWLKLISVFAKKGSKKLKFKDISSCQYSMKTELHSQSEEGKNDRKLI